MRDLLPTLETWTDDGLSVAVATLVASERSAPRDPGAALAVSERGDVVGSVTGGCVEPALYEEAREVLAGGAARFKTYGIADEEAFEVGLACGGTVHVYVWPLEAALLRELAAAVREERPVALVLPLSGGEPRLLASGDGAEDELERHAQDLLARGGAAVVESEQGDAFVDPFVPRPNMYVFGAVEHAAALAELGRFLGYRVTVCDARSRFLTPERFPEVDELVVDWPDRFLERAPIDERTAVCVLTHDHKFDVPLLKVALASPAGYIGALGSRRTTAEREELLRAEGVTDEQLARVRAPIGLKIGGRSPRQVAVAIAAELVQVTHERAGEAASTGSRRSAPAA